MPSRKTTLLLTTLTLGLALTACNNHNNGFNSSQAASAEVAANPNNAPAASVAADDATAIGVDITGTPQLPGTRVTTCDMDTGNCSLP